MAPLIVYITGFRQHAGKTMTSIGLISQLRKHFDPQDLGYMKPVGQEMVQAKDGSFYDKDAAVLERFSQIPDFDPEAISPVRLTSGFTKDYMERGAPVSVQKEMAGKILGAVQHLSRKKVIIAEGTGHPGVGGILNLSNAEVSNLLGAQTLFLSGGGIGKALDQLEVDLSYFIYKKSNVRGVIVNKIIPSKLEQTRKYVNEEFLAERYSEFPLPLKIFGYFPSIGDLDKPSMRTIREKFKGSEILGDRTDSLWIRPMNKVKILSLPEEYLNLENYFQPGDIVILGAGSKNRLKKIIDYHNSVKPNEGLGGVILTCGSVTDLLERSRSQLENSKLPALYVQEDTAASEAILRDCIENTKIQTFDDHKIREIEELFDKHFDYERFAQVLGLKK